MAGSSSYDYTSTAQHLKPFVNPLNGSPFISDMEETYGELWEFKEHVAHWTDWSFVVNRFKSYVYLRCRVQGKTIYLPWNLHEKVAFIEDHQNEYVVMGLREVDDHENEKDHVHSIIMNVNDRRGKFDLDNLITFL